MNKNNMNLLFNTFKKYPLQNIGLNIYALADAAQDIKFLQKLKHLKQKCLLKEASGEKAREVSPHLLQLPQDFLEPEWQWIEKKVAGTAQMTIIISHLSFDDMFQHLRQFLEVEFEGGLELFLAFWDPVILATLVGYQKDKTLYIQGPVFTEEQCQKFLGPIQSWWFWNRIGELHTIFGLSQKDNLGFEIKPLIFNIEQEELMVEATFPDNLIYYLKLNNSFLIDNIDEYELYKFVKKTIPEAREYNLVGTRDILNFICLKLVYQEKFNSDIQLKILLQEVKKKLISMDNAMSKLSNKMS